MTDTTGHDWGFSRVTDTTTDMQVKDSQFSCVNQISPPARGRE